MKGSDTTRHSLVKATIGKRLTLGFALVTALALAAGGMGFYSTQKLSAKLRDLNEVSIPDLMNLSALNLQRMALRAQTMEVFMIKDLSGRQTALETIAKERTESWKVIAGAMEHLQTVYQPTERGKELLENLIASYNLWRTAYDELDQAMEWIRTGAEEDLPIAYVQYRSTLMNLTPISDSFGLILDELIAENKADTSRVVEADYRFALGRANLTLILMILGFGISVLFSFLNIRWIVPPIKAVVEFNGFLSRGDFSREVAEKDLKRTDEIGALARAQQTMVRNVRSLLVSMASSAQAVTASALELSADMTETAASINEVNATIQSIKNQTTSQAASVTETHSTMAQIAQNIEKLDAHIDMQASSVTQSSSAVEQMLANVTSVTEALSRNAQSLNELIAASEKGREDLGNVSASIQEVAKESEGLLEVSGVIQSIASQTNLLAMNAAIEAAHAGDAGRGFAVVADEIRKLAESSGEQAKTVSSVLNKIKDSVSQITESSDMVQRQFDDIYGKIQTVSERDQTIKAAMDEQSSGSNEILQAIGQLNTITSQVKTGSVEMLAGSKEVIRESENLGRITSEVSNGMNEMAAGIQQIATAANRANEISRDNKENIDALTREMGNFKTGGESGASEKPDDLEETDAEEVLPDENKADWKEF